jgi:FKBP-type peptidyl-prolyl cis-trans isomerase FkpA
MKKVVFALMVCAAGFAACTTPFKKAKDGSEYKIISDGKGAKAAAGNFMELNVKALYKDSLLFSSVEDGMPQYGAYDTAAFPPLFKEVFLNIRLGDSIVLRILADSLINKGQSAPFMAKGQYIYQTYKLVGLYSTKEQSDSAQKSHVKDAQAKQYKKQLDAIEKGLTENKALIEADGKQIDAYLAANNIKATKTKWGTYVEMKTEGTGKLVSSSDIVSVNYTGKTFDSSKVFDSNTDPKSPGYGRPLQVAMNQLGGIIPGWPDALLQMKLGSKATVYIPSSLAYGKDGRMPQIKPNSILVFDMEVTEITTEEAQMAKMADQQRIMDSVRAAGIKEAEAKAKKK